MNKGCFPPPCSDEKTDVNWSFSMFAFVVVSLCKIPSLRRGATPVDSVRLPLIKLQNLWFGVPDVIVT
jgi:hypothetical protein